MARLPKCPLCGAKCRRIPYGSVECVKHVRKSILVVRKGKQHMVFGESGCAYEVPDLRAHEAICARFAEKPKRGKVAREVIATGVWDSGKFHAEAGAFCSGPRRVDIVAREGGR